LNKIKCHYTDPLSYYKIAYFLKDYIDDKTLIMCIGTDRCIGDCLGPLVGTFLKDKKFPLNVFGTIDEPIHALNLHEKVSKITTKYPDNKIIGIDACLGDVDTIGEIQVRDFPIHPGKGVGKSLPHIGEVSIIGIIDSSDNNELFTNRNIRLNLVMNMAKVITHSIMHSYYLYSLKKDCK
jgi:putative sporulation protein YyaC